MTASSSQSLSTRKFTHSTHSRSYFGVCRDRIHGAVTSFSWPLFDCRPFIATQTASKPSSQSCEESHQNEFFVISSQNVTITKRFVEVATNSSSACHSCFALLSSHKLSDVSCFHGCCIIVFNVTSHSDFISIYRFISELCFVCIILLVTGQLNYLLAKRWSHSDFARIAINRKSH